MNLILFTADELNRPLPIDDPRAAHIVSVLRMTVGDQLDAGVVDGRRGKATLVSIDQRGIQLSFALDTETPALRPITLLVGAPRPVAAQRILREATTLGVRQMVFCGTDKGEPSYLSAGLWRERHFEKFLIAGAEQAFDTRLPDVLVTETLADALQGLSASDENRIALDNYEATIRLGQWTPAGHGATVLAVGSERGWSDSERRSLEGQGFTLAGLGDRILRTETACLAGLALLMFASQPSRSGEPALCPPTDPHQHQHDRDLDENTHHRGQ